MFKIIIFVSLLLTLIQCAPMTKEDGKKFLKTYGYMSNDTTNDADFEKSLQDFQDTFTLPATGKLDSETINQMDKPRCGRPDKQEIKNTKRKWDKQKLTYKFKSFPKNGLEKLSARKELERAFNVWAQHAPLEFEEKYEGRVDIDINFNENGDGPGKTLAYAFFPKVGNIHFDNEEWTVNSKKGFNLFLVAAHEIGHSLGLSHSMNRNALLYPYIGSYDPNFQLHDDDISRIQDLYGQRSVDICNINQIDSVLYNKTEKAVFITKDDNCWKIKDNKVESGYPKSISDEWKGSPSSVNAAYNYGNKIYFHEGKNVWKYDGTMQVANTDYQIRTNIDGGVSYNERMYIFKGHLYYRYDNMKLAIGYPKAISSYWTGVPDSIDDVYYEDNYPNKYFYFFKGTRVYKFNMDDKTMNREMTLREYLNCV